MRKFQVNVNGKQYVVEVEEMAAGASNATPVAAASTSPAAAPYAATPASSASVNGAATGTAEGREVKAPLRGQILRVDVAVGDRVTRNQVLLTIEALKLENEIVSPVDGVVSGVFANANTTAEVGDTLVTIKEN